jgi:hypothetical protein
LTGWPVQPFDLFGIVKRMVDDEPFFRVSFEHILRQM